ncbi:MAG: hypothetical protein KBS83_04835 [Lachnospiraceae bacterium]|nr:hypothetical protein [Candidatus Equihabitans merdae]
MGLSIFAACGKKAEPNEAQESATVGMANPVHECDKDEMTQESSIDLDAPKGAENVKYSYIDGDKDQKIAQVEFTLDGHDYCYRALRTSDIIKLTADDPNLTKEEMEAIKDSGIEIAQTQSGYYEMWNKYGNQPVSYCDAIFMAKDGGAGVICWFDVVPGILYTLSTDNCPSTDTLVNVANSTFVSAQGES